jgi:uncharacterized membrane protein (UPF0136 family)
MMAAPSSTSRNLAQPLAFLWGFLIMVVWQSANSGLIGSDSFYHVKMALMLPQWGFPDHFPWLQWTLFRDQFVSHHYGFHVLLSPWVWAGELLLQNPFAGAKLAVCFASGLTSWLFFRLVTQRDVPHPWFWTILLVLLPWHYWMRHAYIRAPVVALPLLLLAVSAILARRPRTAGLLAFLFVQVYFGAVIFIGVPTAFVLGRLLAGEADRRDGALLFWTALGLAAGFIINPYFPQNLAFMKVQLLETGLGNTVKVGNEWRPLDSWSLLVMSAPLVLIWALSLLLQLQRGRKLDGASLGLLFLHAFFLLLTLKARRFVEYWPLFALLNAADLARWSVQELPDRWRKTRSGFAQVVLAGLLLLVAMAAPGWARGYRVMQRKADPESLVTALRFLRDNTEAGSLVLTDDWDQFPVCFYYNTHNHYAVGLDPAFTAVPYPELWDRYRLITSGRTPAPLSAAFTVLEKKEARVEDIATHVGAHYVLVRDDHPRFYRQLLRATNTFTRIFPAGQDNDVMPAASVFRVHAAGSIPPTPAPPATP